MPAQNKTSLGLNQWEGNEYPKRIDFVEDNKIIDDELNKRVEYTDTATETKVGIARIHSLDTAENQSNEFQNMIANNLQSQISDFIRNLNHDEILTVKSLVKYLSKTLKPATEDGLGLINYSTIKMVAPKPDLSPYVPYSKGYRVKDNNAEFVRTNGTVTWGTYVHEMYNEAGNYLGKFHVNGGRAYYAVPNRNNNNWNEIMDNHDMAARDNRINGVESRANDAWNRTQDLYNLRNTDNNDKWQNYVREIRLAGYIIAPVWSGNQLQERGGYVITGFVNSDGDIGGGDYGQMRAIQFYRNGSWLNTYFA